MKISVNDISQAILWHKESRVIYTKFFVSFVEIILLFTNTFSFVKHLGAFLLFK